MAFIKPQLASPVEKLNLTVGGTWVMEEKLDGHRLIVEVEAAPHNLLNADVKRVKAWSRNAIARILPTHVTEALGQLPVGIYDGELMVPGRRSYGVTELVNNDRLVYVVFDILEAEGVATCDLPLETRRALLHLIFQHPVIASLAPVRLAEQREIATMNDVVTWRDEVWARDGEGLILKRSDAPYVPGKRSKDWIKIKALRTSVLTVEDWQESRGKLNDRGPYAIVVLVDGAGNHVTVKVKDDATLATINEAAKTTRRPFLGRRLRIEYQERTPDGSYRHPRWDRWEDE